MTNSISHGWGPVTSHSSSRRTIRLESDVHVGAVSLLSTFKTVPLSSICCIKRLGSVGVLDDRFMGDALKSPQIIEDSPLADAFWILDIILFHIRRASLLASEGIYMLCMFSGIPLFVWIFTLRM